PVGVQVRNARNLEAIALVAQATDEENGDPHTSVRSIATQLGMSKSSVHTILRKDLNMRPWKIWQVQKLSVADKEMRVAACDEFFDLVHEAERNPQFPGDRFVNRVIWSDECTISNEGHFNGHNFHHWAQENPHCTAETHIQGSWKINVWAGVLHNKIIGPHFFEENENLNQFNYSHLLRHQLPEMLEDTPLNILRSCWFMQDGAAPHTSRRAREILNSDQHYGWQNKWIGKYSNVQTWPPRSPDLTPCDFWLWGTLKSRLFPVKGARYENREDLIAAVERECRAISEEEITRLWECMLRRFGACLAADGGHFEHL
ncbi:Transposable element Tc1 transposase, partial [Frankliniella fusca]